MTEVSSPQVGRSSGWFVVPRGLMDDPAFRPGVFTEHSAYMWSYERAAFEDHTIWFGGVRVALKRGQIATSIRDMAKAFGWSEKRVRGFTQRMISAGKWTLRRAQGGAHAPSLITFEDYETFQCMARGRGTREDTPEGTRGAHEGHARGTEENEGNELNEGEDKASPRKLALVSALPFDEAVGAWNEAAARCGWRTVRGAKGSKPDRIILNADQRRKLGARLKEHGLDGWLAAIDRAEQSEWLGGQSPPGWWNFSALISAEKFSKLMDGSYDRDFTRTSGRQGSSWGSGHAAWEGIKR